MSPVQDLINRVVEAQKAPGQAASASGDTPAQAAEKAATVANQQEKPNPAEETAKPNGATDVPRYAFKVKRGDAEETMELTEGQIVGTMDRYRALNAKHSAMSPIVSLAEQIMERTGGDANKAAAILVKGLQTMMGQSEKPDAAAKVTPKPAGSETFDWDEWAKREGFDSAEPFKQTHNMVTQQGQAIQALTDNMQQLARLIGGAMQQGNLLNQNIMDQAGQINSQRQDLEKQRIGQNLSAAQQKYKLPDEQQEAFMDFAAQRGLVIWDFIDPQLTDRLVSDFVNQQKSSQADRLVGMAQRRLAMSGSVSNTPAAGTGAPGADAPAKKSVDKLFDYVKSTRS